MSSKTLSTQAASSVYDFTVEDVKGKPYPLSKLKSKKALLFVNVASEWGLTAKNYQELAQLYDKYSGQGLEILAFPCNQFGGQEPGSAPEVEAFARERGGKFPVRLSSCAMNHSKLYLYEYVYLSVIAP